MMKTQEASLESVHFALFNPGTIQRLTDRIKVFRNRNRNHFWSWVSLQLAHHYRHKAANDMRRLLYNRWLRIDPWVAPFTRWSYFDSWLAGLSWKSIRRVRSLSSIGQQTRRVAIFCLLAYLAKSVLLTWALLMPLKNQFRWVLDYATTK